MTILEKLWLTKFGNSIFISLNKKCYLVLIIVCCSVNFYLGMGWFL